MKKLLRGIEIVFLVIVLFTLYVLVDNVYQESGRLIALAGSDFDKAKEAYELVLKKRGELESVTGGDQDHGRLVRENRRSLRGVCFREIWGKGSG